ncbi:MAG TPA: hydrogenase 4 subunit B, partial [Azospirillaceae bacterium]|nr:hydrogenase 4 subunit B [Azospirillaceae bacterium]
LEPGRVLPAYPLFLAGMLLVLAAGDAFVFLAGWEFMSLGSWLLVLATHREAETPRAARVYLVMACLGTLALMLCFGLLAGAGGDYRFEAMRAAERGPLLASAAVMLALLGAGSKAGLAPLHVWLPLAHPAAPSHVSALMSGVMTKVALYGLVRVAFDLAGAPQGWWGGVLMAVGALTAVAGVLYALLQEDLKRLLAYSTVENVGLVAIALGLALVFRADGREGVAALALAAGLLHAVNHGFIKTLLFLGAGAVLDATGERRLDRLGGLIRRMPCTAPLFLLGSAAICALPPLNGFVSEWLVFQAVLSGPQLSSWGMRIAVMVVGVALALSAALAAACFVRAFGIAFLGRARGAAAAGAVEVRRPMVAAMALPAALCLLLGLLPGLGPDLVEPAVRQVLGTAPGSRAGAFSWLWLAPDAGADGFGGNSYGALFLAVTAVGLGVALARLVRRHAGVPVRRADPWGCGYPDAGPGTQYTAAGLSQPLRRVFGSVAFAAEERVEMPEPGETRPARFAVALRDPAWDFLATPVVRAAGWAADRLNGLHSLSIRRHLSLMFAALVLLLLALAVLR